MIVKSSVIAMSYDAGPYDIPSNSLRPKMVALSV